MEQLFKQADSCKTLRTIIKIGGATITDEEKTLSKETGITIHTMDEVMVSKESYHSGKCSISAESANFEQLMHNVMAIFGSKWNAAGIDRLESIDS